MYLRDWRRRASQRGQGPWSRVLSYGRRIPNCQSMETVFLCIFLLPAAKQCFPTKLGHCVNHKLWYGIYSNRDCSAWEKNQWELWRHSTGDEDDRMSTTLSVVIWSGDMMNNGNDCFHEMETSLLVLHRWLWSIMVPCWHSECQL